MLSECSLVMSCYFTPQSTLKRIQPLPPLKACKKPLNFSCMHTLLHTEATQKKLKLKWEKYLLPGIMSK